MGRNADRGNRVQAKSQRYVRLSRRDGAIERHESAEISWAQGGSKFRTVTKNPERGRLLRKIWSEDSRQVRTLDVNIGIVRRVSVFWRQLRQLASMSRPCMAEAYPVASRYAGRPAGVVRPVRGGMVRDAA